MKYRITREIEQSNGTQTWIVEANSKEEAIKNYNAGEGEFEAEEVEVTELGKPIASLET